MPGKTIGQQYDNALRFLEKLQKSMSAKQAAAQIQIDGNDFAGAVKILDEALTEYDQGITKVSVIFDRKKAPSTFNCKFLDQALSQVNDSQGKIITMNEIATARLATAAAAHATVSGNPATLVPPSAPVFLEPLTIATPAAGGGDFGKSPTPYEIAMSELQQEYNAQTNQKLKDKIMALVQHISRLHEKRKLSPGELIAALNSTTFLLNTLRTNPSALPTALHDHEKLAQTMQGSSSAVLKVLGGLMIAVAITALVLGVMLLTGPMAPLLPMIFALTIAATEAAANAMAIGAVATVAAAPLLGAAGFFAQGCRSGLSKEMGNLGKEVNRVDHVDNTPTPA
jgi:hypothetical protein